MATPTTSLFSLPPEIRLQIYSDVLADHDLLHQSEHEDDDDNNNHNSQSSSSSSSTTSSGRKNRTATAEPALLQTCALVQAEATKAWYRRLLAISARSHHDHVAAHDNFVRLLSRHPINALEACAVAHELDQQHDTFQRTCDRVRAELSRIAARGYPVARWCERDGEAATQAYWGGVELEPLLDDWAGCPC